MSKHYSKMADVSEIALWVKAWHADQLGGRVDFFKENVHMSVLSWGEDRVKLMPIIDAPERAEELDMISVIADDVLLTAEQARHLGRLLIEASYAIEERDPTALNVVPLFQKEDTFPLD